MIRACGVQGEKEECNVICQQAKLYGFEVVDKCPKDNIELIEVLANNGKFDYIYLSSHGSDEGFGDSSGLIGFSWFDFGVHLCSSMCMNNDCIVMLSCCRGGLHQVAFDLFYCCGKISYIVGPRQSLTPYEMLISFNILLFNIEHRNIDPVVACEKIKNATDIRFVCFDRLETEVDPAYIWYIQGYNIESNEILNNAKEVAGEAILSTETKN